MLPHPTAIDAVTALRRHDLLATIKQDRRAWPVRGRVFRVDSLPAEWPLLGAVTVVVIVMGLFAVGVYARALPTVANSASEARAELTLHNPGTDLSTALLAFVLDIPNESSELRMAVVG